MILFTWLMINLINMNEINFITQKKRALIWPIVFLWFVIVLSVILFLFNFKLNNDIIDLEKKILERNSEIKILKDDSKVQVFSLIEANKNTIDNLEKRSYITNFIKHLNAISQKYDVVFESFSISQWIIKVQASFESSDKGIAYIKTSNFVNSYRKDENALFNLNFISSFEWMDYIKFEVEFSIK